MSDHPYKHLPPHCFWRDAVSQMPLEQIDPVVAPKFQIDRTHRVVTAGSCFAQHVARRLSASGYNHFITEAAHPMVAYTAPEYGYGMFSARYGNIYTARQLIQLLHRAYGILQPLDDLWPAPDGHVIDPYRPRIQPKGFATRREFTLDRAQHFAAIRRAVEQMDVFVFTLGLTESWMNTLDGTVYPLCPGVAGGEFKNHHRFVNFSAAEVTADLEQALDFILLRNPTARIIITVSPVPLVATAENRSVIVSTVYSKSVLRVAAEQASANRTNVAYFPSYEIITSPAARGAYFASDLRSVNEAGVSHVMRLFFRHYGSEPADNAYAPTATHAAAAHIRDMEEVARVMCDEEELDRRAPATA